MHKKLEAELMSIAHTILQMKNKNDVVALKEKSRILYERLSILSFVDEYIETTPNTQETKESLISKIETAKPIEIIEEEIQEDKEDIKLEIDEVIVEVAEIIKREEEGVKEHGKEVEIEIVQEIIELVTPEIVEPKKNITIEEEFRDTVSVDVTTNLFTKIEAKSANIKVSLNDKLQSNIQVGLNDRIGFVKHLFNHSQADFNRVLSQLNSFKTEKEALSFINKMVKPDYDWSGKEEFEDRLLEIINRKFL
jgi:hypothetical protein